MRSFYGTTESAGNIFWQEKITLLIIVKLGLDFETPRPLAIFLLLWFLQKSNYYVYLCLLFFVFYILCYLFDNGFSLLSLICWICYGFISFFCVYYGLNSVAYLIFLLKFFSKTILFASMGIYLFVYLLWIFIQNIPFKNNIYIYITNKISVFQRYPI